MLAPVDAWALNQTLRLVDNDTTSVVFGGGDMFHTQTYVTMKTKEPTNVELSRKGVKNKID